MKRPMQISRKQFFALVAASTLAARKSLSAAKPEKILVIGAGIAGLAAARQLKSAGHTVIILEGRSRIGGRIHTSREIGAPIDLGAAWIHGSDSTDHPIVQLAKQVKARTVETDFDAMQLFTRGGVEIDTDQIEDAYESIESGLLKKRDRLQDQRKDISMGGYLDELLSDAELSDLDRRALAWVFRTNYGVELGADLETLSLRSLDEDLAFGEDESIFPGGYEAIIQFLAQGLDIRLGQVAQAIALKSDSVEVTTGRREKFSADRLIVTLPLGVLKANRVAFSPPLPEKKQRAIASLGFGSLEKIALRFPKQFWPDEIFQFGYVPPAGQTPVIHEFYNYRPYTNLPVLVGLGGGKQGRQLQANSTAAVAGMLEVLREVFGNGIPQPIKSQVTGWTSDPFTLGAYTHVTIGASLSQCETLSEPIADRIFFAGEHTSARYPGTTHGAYLSGLAAARAI